jgi:uncharacterized MnhB-related membrane protein
VNFRDKKLLLIAVMLIVLIAFLIMVSQRNLVGQVVCLGVTGALFLATRRKQNRKQ